MRKQLNIGLRQARRLCQMPHDERLAFLSEGLPIILTSAQDFWQASCQLKDRLREAEVLKGFAEEEAAKILILMDAVRCPMPLINSRIGKITGWFYDHLARLIYTETVRWRQMDVSELREFIEKERESHYLEGFCGEFVVPNWNIYQRESRLYADIATYGDGKFQWNRPNLLQELLSASYSPSVPPVLELAEAMSALGIFTHRGLKATSEIWAQITFTTTETSVDAGRLTRQLLKRLCEDDLPSPKATQEHARVLLSNWQIPMYDLDLRPINVPLEKLRKEQEQMLWEEVGDAFVDY
ncbi:MAG: hypothetical protein OXU26_02695 [Acidobacteriota bacterium]|nr:hypothetical protein [Acidobacteriota bacterium]MDE2962797.1 hypothetical protein [Acidobacteriota bacterium]